MIEPALFFALGVMLASLTALLMLPAVSRRAHRRAAAHLERQMPLTKGEIAAGRDHLRAGHAVAVRQLEQRLASLAERLAASRSEAGRQTVELVAQAQSLAAARDRIAAAEAAGEVARAAAEAEAATHAQALRDLAADNADREAALGEAMGRIADLTSRLEAPPRPAPVDEPPAIAAHAPVPARMPAPGAAALATDVAPDALHAATARFRSEQALLLASVAAATAERDRLRLRIDELLLRVEALQEDAEEATHGASADRRQAIKQARTIATLQQRLAAGEEAAAALKQQLAEEQARQAARDAAELPLFGAPGTPAPQDAAALRQAVASLAANLVRFSAPAEAAVAPPAARPSRKPRRS